MSGECNYKMEFLRGEVSYNFMNHKSRCIKRRIELSLNQNEKCKDNAPYYISRVWDHCRSDYAPFDHCPY